MKRKVVRIGNSLGVTLPAEALERCGLVEGQTVVTEVREDAIWIHADLSLKDLFDSWEPVASGVSSQDVTEAIGRDRQSH